MTKLPPPLRIEPRWTDLDPVGHVNNTVFLVYAEEARNRFLGAAVPDAWNNVVVAHNSVDYHSSIEATDVVRVTSSVESIGRSSMSTVNEISTEEGRLCATIRTVQVVLSPDDRRPRRWTDGERAILGRFVRDREGT